MWRTNNFIITFSTCRLFPTVQSTWTQISFNFIYLLNGLENRRNCFINIFISLFAKNASPTKRTTCCAIKKAHGKHFRNNDSKFRHEKLIALLKNTIGYSIFFKTLKVQKVIFKVQKWNIIYDFKILDDLIFIVNSDVKHLWTSCVFELTVF